MAEFGTHLPKKVFKTEKRSYIDDEKKRNVEKLKKNEISVRVSRVCVCVHAYMCERAYYARLCARVCEHVLRERE